MIVAAVPTIVAYRAQILERGDEIVYGKAFVEGPRVSVITPVFNAGATIARAIGVVAGQTLAGVEHVIVDGCSNDGTDDLVRASQDRIGIFIRGRDSGTSDATNKGLALARGRYIALLPADDEFSSGHLERAVETLERTGADFVYGRSMMRFPGGRVRYYTPSEDYAARALIGHTAIDMRTMVARRELFESLGLLRLDLRYGNDLDWLIRTVKAGHKGVYDESLFVAADWGGLTTREPFSSSLEACRIALQAGGPVFPILKLFARSVVGQAIRRLLSRISPDYLSMEWGKPYA